MSTPVESPVPKALGEKRSVLAGAHPASFAGGLGMLEAAAPAGPSRRARRSCERRPEADAAWRIRQMPRREA